MNTLAHLPPNLDAEQAKIVTLTLAALSKLDKVRADPFPSIQDEEIEERSLDCIQEQMDELSEEEFARLLRALIDAWAGQVQHG
jgi:hypothetical protein